MTYVISDDLSALNFLKPLRPFTFRVRSPFGLGANRFFFGSAVFPQNPWISGFGIFLEASQMYASVVRWEPGDLWYLECLRFRDLIPKHFERYLKWRNPKHLYKLYGYGLCKRQPTPKIAENKVQETLHSRYLKLLVIRQIWWLGWTLLDGWLDDFPPPLLFIPCFHQEPHQPKNNSLTGHRVLKYSKDGMVPELLAGTPNSCDSAIHYCPLGLGRWPPVDKK